jgi:hypothetical protein
MPGSTRLLSPALPSPSRPPIAELAGQLGDGSVIERLLGEQRLRAAVQDLAVLAQEVVGLAEDPHDQVSDRIVDLPCGILAELAPALGSSAQAVG